MAGQLGKSAATVHLDNIRDMGFYYVAENGESIGAPSKYGILLVFNTKGWYSSIQIFFGILTGKVSFRHFQAAWSSWLAIN